MRRLLSFFLIICPFIIQAQSSTSQDAGIHFENSSWKQVQTKAKAENKYIFVDCYTTWCAPCKRMEKEVYSSKKVGEFFNKKFISIKMQMDTAQSDNAEIKKTYVDAALLCKTYKVTMFPTFLFFTPDGNLLQRNAGAQEEDAFIASAMQAIDPVNDYYVQLRDFHNGKRNLQEMSFVARKASEFEDVTTTEAVSKAYISSLKKDSLLTPANIKFMWMFTKHSVDLGFTLFYNNISRINSIMKDDTYAQALIYNVIYQEVAFPFINKARLKGEMPNWMLLNSQIQKKYNSEFAERVIIGARMSWAAQQGNWPEYTKYFVKNVEKYGSKMSGQWQAFALNNNAWEIFLYSNDKMELNTALNWSGRAILMEPNDERMDTFANILYKLGRIKEAITWEKTAIKLNPTNKGLERNLDKMQKGQSTWIKSEM